MTKAYIVWSNERKLEGVVFKDKDDALWTSTGKRKYCPTGFYPSLGHDLREDNFDDIDTDDVLPMSEVTIND